MLDTILNIAIWGYNMWEATFSIIGVVCTALGLREIWSPKNQNQSLQTKIQLSLFYILHITAIFFAAGILGESLLSAAAATLLVSMTSLINDGFDYIQQLYTNYKIEQKLQKVKEQLSRCNIDFKHNSFFFQDIFELQDEIEGLEIQQNELLVYLDQIIKQQGNYSIHISLTNQIIAALRERLDSIIDENAIIAEFKNGLNKNLSEYEIIETINEKIKTLHSKDVNDTQIKKLYIINQHYYRMIKAKATIVEIKQQLQDIDAKYLVAPFNEYTQDEITALKKLEIDYLNENISSLHDYIHVNEKGDTNNLARSQDAIKKLDSISILDQSADKQALENILREQILQIQNIIKIKHEKLQEKEKYQRLIAINPHEQLPKDLAKMLNKARKFIKHECAFELAKIETRQKLSAARYSIFTAFFAIVMCFSSTWIMSNLFNNLMRFVGVMAGIASINGYVRMWYSQSDIELLQKKQLETLIEECTRKAINLKISPTQHTVKDKLITIIDEMKNNLAAREAASASPSYINDLKDYLPYSTSLFGGGMDNSTSPIVSTYASCAANKPK